MMHCVGDRGCHTSEPDLADPARTELIDLFIGIVEEVDVNRRRVCINRHYVIGEIAVDGCSVLWIVSGFFKQGHANSHHDRTLNLIPTSERIQDTTSVHHGYNTAHAQARYLRLPRHFDKMAAV